MMTQKTVLFADNEQSQLEPIKFKIEALGYRILTAVSVSEAMQSLKQINNNFGNLLSYKLDSWNVTKSLGTAGMGTYYDFKFDVIYSHYLIIENITLSKSLSGDEIKIQGYNFNSSALLK